MKNNGLKADGYSKWIPPEINEENILWILNEYVIKTPSYGTSKKSRDLFNFYGYTDAQEYKNLYDELLKNMDTDNVAFCNSYEDLKNSILNHPIMCFLDATPIPTAEVVLCYAGSNSEDKLFKNCFPELKVDAKGKKNLERQSEAEFNRNIVYIDKLFAHIRNAFAHGSFADVVYNGETYFFLQDENNNGYISARMLLKETTLKEWLCVLERHRSKAEKTCEELG